MNHWLAGSHEASLVKHLQGLATMLLSRSSTSRHSNKPLLVLNDKCILVAEICPSLEHLVPTPSFTFCPATSGVSTHILLIQRMPSLGLKVDGSDLVHSSSRSVGTLPEWLLVTHRPVCGCKRSFFSCKPGPAYIYVRRLNPKIFCIVLYLIKKKKKESDL